MARRYWYLDDRDVWCFCPPGQNDAGTVLQVSVRKWHASMYRTTSKGVNQSKFFRSLKTAQLWVEVIWELER